MNHSAFGVLKWMFLTIGMIFLVGALSARRDSMLVLAAIGAVFGGIGGAIYYYTWWAAKKQAHLQENGHLVQAEFLRVELDRSLKVNGESPYRIVAQWKDEGDNQVHVFRSASIWFDPAPYIHESSVPVYLDPLKPSYYFMDVSFLPKAKK
ncbi:MAG: hypothetical protein EOO54_06205 [Haliea sp.]|nr:MAG: hypothetical protein EOO54_06205 [Haliea sp.]